MEKKVKRIGVLTMLTFLRANGHEICATNAEIYNVGMALGKGELPYFDLLAWVNTHTKE